MALVAAYKFHRSSSASSTRGRTPAARMPHVSTAEVKRRSRALTRLFESYSTYDRLVGSVQRACSPKEQGRPPTSATRSATSRCSWRWPRTTRATTCWARADVRVVAAGKHVVGEAVRDSLSASWRGRSLRRSTCPRARAGRSSARALRRRLVQCGAAATASQRMRGGAAVAALADRLRPGRGRRLRRARFATGCGPLQRHPPTASGDGLFLRARGAAAAAAAVAQARQPARQRARHARTRERACSSRGRPRPRPRAGAERAAAARASESGRHWSSTGMTQAAAMGGAAPAPPERAASSLRFPRAGRAAEPPRCSRRQGARVEPREREGETEGRRPGRAARRGQLDLRCPCAVVANGRTQASAVLGVEAHGDYGAIFPDPRQIDAAAARGRSARPAPRAAAPAACPQQGLRGRRSSASRRQLRLSCSPLQRVPWEQWRPTGAECLPSGPLMPPSTKSSTLMRL